MPERRCAVYRHYNAASELLYVGKTVDPEKRWRQHKVSGKLWPSLVDHTEIVWFDNRRDATVAEADAIWREAPAHNYQRLLDGLWIDYGNGPGGRP